MPGYSQTPLPQKLGIKDAHRVALLHAPTGFESALAGSTAAFARSLRGRAHLDIILLFCPDARTLRTDFSKAAARLAQNGGLWVCWPKKSSGVATDLTEDAIRTHGLTTGLVDNKVCAVTEIWSGLRFVIRLKDRKSPESR